MRTQPSAGGTYRRLVMALGASLLVVALGPHPRALPFDLLLSRAAIAAGAGQPADALAWLDEAIAFDPALGALHLPAAQLALQSGDAAGLRSHLQAAPPGIQASVDFACLLAHLPADQMIETMAATDACNRGGPSPAESGPHIPPHAELAAAAAALPDQLKAQPAGLSGWGRLA